jgi:hypothetical protein
VCVFAITSILVSRIAFEMLGWLPHILIDIPTQLRQLRDAASLADFGRGDSPVGSSPHRFVVADGFKGRAFSRTVPECRNLLVVLAGVKVLPKASQLC